MLKMTGVLSKLSEGSVPTTLSLESFAWLGTTHFEPSTPLINQTEMITKLIDLPALNTQSSVNRNSSLHCLALPMGEGLGRLREESWDLKRVPVVL